MFICIMPHDNTCFLTRIKTQKQTPRPKNPDLHTHCRGTSTQKPKYGISMRVFIYRITVFLPLQAVMLGTSLYCTYIYNLKSSKSQNILVDAYCITFSNRYSKNQAFESFQIAFHRKVGEPTIEGHDLPLSPSSDRLAPFTVQASRTKSTSK